MTTFKSIFIIQVLVAFFCSSTSIKIDYLTSATVRTDPIVNPNGLSGHVHTFFGASVASPSTTYQDLRNANGNSGNVVENKSLYWYPTIYRFDPAQEKYFIAPIWHHSSYYIWQTGQARAFPDGFKMIIHGSSQCTTYTENGNIFHKCGKAEAECVKPGNCPNGDCSTLNGFFPPQTCAELEMSLEFPSCWDGVNLDVADHRSHVRYDDEIESEEDACPASHPIRLPKVFIFTRIRNYPGGKHLFSDGTGVFHSDYFSGWKESELQYVLDNCETDSMSPASDSYCDNGPAGIQNGFNSNPRFLTFLDAPKKDHVADADIQAKIRNLVTPEIDVSHITREQIDGVPYLPGSGPVIVPTTTTSTTSRATTTTTQRPTTTSTSTQRPTTTSTTTRRPTTTTRRTTTTTTRSSGVQNYSGPFLPPWNDEPSLITSWAIWCEVELTEGCESCENSEGAARYCKRSCADAGCTRLRRKM